MDGRSSKKIVPNEDALLEKNTLIGGRNVVLKVKRDEEFVMPSTMNPWLKCMILGIWAQAAKSRILFNLKKFNSKNIVHFLD
ncbi:unnamed protein product [Onchocerca flexuosa]|uniref:Uncharacterized protein n=1 Tax=Onchocerca flexuosa TaxID=387005 RepID=A0A183H209_9BILA|nr:unnamed protein product [Onchocerca flexuosa]